MAKAVNNGRRVARTRHRCAQSCGVLHMQCSPSLSFLVYRPCRCDALADCVTEELLWTVLCRLTVVSRHRLARLSSPAGDVPIHPKPSPDGSVGVEGGQLSETWGFVTMEHCSVVWASRAGSVELRYHVEWRIRPPLRKAWEAVDPVEKKRCDVAHCWGVGGECSLLRGCKQASRKTTAEGYRARVGQSR